MKTPVARGVPISDESAAKFTATIDINEPRLIEVTAYGPLVNLQAANKVSANGSSPANTSPAVTPGCWNYRASWSM
jgi:hypothetical protein